MPSDQSNWLDAMLPGAAKQALGAESLNAKLILNAVKDGATKEIVNKDAAISMPASYQPAAQINANLSTQQAGSANNINVYPGKTGWDQAISQKVVWMVGAGEQSATLTLNPPDLGPLQVVIHVHNDQADTTFISDNAEVRQALQDGLSNLRDKMSESGIQLGQANVSSGEQSQQQFQQAAQQGLGATQFSGNGTASVAEKAGAANALVRVSNGLVDTFA
jgi:flagellar hook-length control protein FliK